MRMTICSLSPLVAQLNEAQTEMVRLIGFALFLKVDMKQIPGKFSKWLGDNFVHYSTFFKVSDGQKFPVAALDVYVTLCVPIGGKKIVEITKSFVDEEYDEVHAVCLKLWKINQTASERTRMP